MRKGKKTGCLFGSFNPIHNGHLMVAQFMATQTDLDEVELVVSPHNPLKDREWLADEQHRLAMVRMAVEDNPLLSVNDIEFDLSRPSYTIDTLAAMSNRRPGLECTLIMGSDILVRFRQWKAWELILENHDCYVYLRPNEDPGELASHQRVKIFNAPSIHLSSTFIRDSLEAGYSTKYLIPDNVRNYIDKHDIYVRTNEKDSQA